MDLPESIQHAIERVIGRNTTRDIEFDRHFGRFQRPDHLRQYPLEKLGRLVRWGPGVDGIIDVSRFILSLNPEDRRIAGEIARFTAEEFEGKPATDKTINTFRLQFLRRLDAVGF